MRNHLAIRRAAVQSRPLRQAIEALDARQLFAGNVFAPPTTLTTGSNPMGVAGGDFNSDGINDLVVASASPTAPGFYVYFGTGTGSFGPGRLITTSYLPKGLVSGDFNHDGKPDVAVAEAVLSVGTGAVEVFASNADGTFGAGTRYATALGTSAVTAGDINKDGYQDLIATNTTSGTVSILTGKAGGTFNAATSVNVGLSPTSAKLADFDEDGKLDMVVSTLTDVRYLKGGGDGTFAAATSIYSFAQSLSLQTGGIATADVNGDGHADVLVPSISGAVAVLGGKGNGTFTTPTTGLPGTLAAGVATLAADLNNDGSTDTAAIDRTNGRLVLDYGATLTSAASETVYNIGTNPSSLDLIDINGDRRPDLVVTNAGSSTVSILMNTATSFQSAFLSPLLRSLTIFGTDGNDTMTLATKGSQLFATLNGVTDRFALADFDTVYLNAGSGNDLVDFTATNRSINASGGYGDDTIYAGGGNDSLFGSMGNDVLDGGAGNDRIDGWKGKDYLFGGDGDDRMYGGAGNDIMEGNSGKDRLFGGDGNDVLNGSQGNDRLYGEAGDDLLIGGLGNNLLDGGTGKDTAATHAGDILNSIELFQKD